MRKIPFAGVELTSQRVRGLRGTSELPGRPACAKNRRTTFYASSKTNNVDVVMAVFTEHFALIRRDKRGHDLSIRRIVIL